MYFNIAFRNKVIDVKKIYAYSNFAPNSCFCYSLSFCHTMMGNLSNPETAGNAVLPHIDSANETVLRTLFYFNYHY